MKTVAVTIINEKADGSFLKPSDWEQVIDSLRHIVHSYNMQQLSKLENNSYLIGVLGKIDESDYEALVLSVAVACVAWDLVPAYVGEMSPAETPLKISVKEGQ